MVFDEIISRITFNLENIEEDDYNVSTQANILPRYLNDWEACECLKFYFISD